MSSVFERSGWSAVRSVIEKVRKFAYSGPLKSPDRPSSRPRLGLALSGGFAHGVAHLGVLKVLVENQIPIDALAGTSVGSVVAAAFASGCPLDEMIEEARQVRWKTFGRWGVARLGLATNERMEAMLHRVLRCSAFEDLRVPLAVVAADISTGETVVFRRGELIPPLRASCSVPGLFIPIPYQGRLLVDGAIVANVPAGPLEEMGVDRIVAVDLTAHRFRRTPTNIFQVIGQSLAIAQNLNQTNWRKNCDVVIEPEVSGINWDAFERADELIATGERATREALPALRALASAHALAEPARAPAS